MGLFGGAGAAGAAAAGGGGITYSRAWMLKTHLNTNGSALALHRRRCLTIATIPPILQNPQDILPVSYNWTDRTRP